MASAKFGTHFCADISKATKIPKGKIVMEGSLEEILL